MTDKRIRYEKKYYTVDDFYYRTIKRLRQRISNMKGVIVNYTERIKVKQGYLNDIYKDIVKKNDKKN